MMEELVDDQAIAQVTLMLTQSDNEFMDVLDTACDLNDEVVRLRGLLEEVASCAIEFSDPRIRYVTIQLPVALWEELQEGIKCRNS